MSVIDVYFLHLAVCTQNTSTERHLQTWVSHVYLLMRSSPCPWGVEQIPCKGNSYQLLESTISSFQSDPYTFNHSWRSGHKSTHKLRALPMGSGASLHCNGPAFSTLLSFVNKSVTSARAAHVTQHELYIGPIFISQCESLIVSRFDPQTPQGRLFLLTYPGSFLA